MKGDDPEKGYHVTTEAVDTSSVFVRLIPTFSVSFSQVFMLRVLVISGFYQLGGGSWENDLQLLPEVGLV